MRYGGDSWILTERYAASRLHTHTFPSPSTVEPMRARPNCVKNGNPCPPYADFSIILRRITRAVPKHCCASYVSNGKGSTHDIIRQTEIRPILTIPLDPADNNAECDYIKLSMQGVYFRFQCDEACYSTFSRDTHLSFDSDPSHECLGCVWGAWEVILGRLRGYWFSTCLQK